jgi:hypothetical protein
VPEEELIHNTLEFRDAPEYEQFRDDFFHPTRESAFDSDKEDFDEFEGDSTGF